MSVAGVRLMTVRSDPDVRERYRQDAKRAWEQYQATGLHVTFEEADTWFARLEMGEDAEVPKCHV